MRRFNAVAVTVALMTSAVACLGSNEPDTAPTTPTPPPTSAAPTTPTGPTPPVRPAAVMKRDKAGVIAAVEYFIATLNYSGATGDTKPFRSSFTNFCNKCDGIADAMERVYSQGGRVTGDGWSTTRIDVVDVADDLASVEAFIDQARQVWLERPGEQPTIYNSSAGNSRIMQTYWRPKFGWRVDAYEPDLSAP